MISKSFDKALDRAFDTHVIEKLVILILAVMFGLYAAISITAQTDTTPATFDDYYSLNEKLVALQEDHSLALKEEGTLVVTDENIRYTVENDQCKMTGIYTHDYKLVGKEQTDKRIHPATLILIAALIAALIGFIVYTCVSYILVIPIYFIIFIIVDLVKHKKEKAKVKVNENTVSEDIYFDDQDIK